MNFQRSTFNLQPSTFNRLLLESLLALLLLSTINHQLSTVFAQGSFTPPGPPAPTMKSLDQIEPRTPISSLPFSITNAGSYYLTTNLIAGAATGINIGADNVTLDLLGFELIGGSALTSGILVSGTHTNICIRNGSISRWAGAGVGASSALYSQARDLRVINNGALSPGISLGNDGFITACISRGHGGGGILAGTNCVLKDCIAEANTAGIGSPPGISVGSGSVVQACTAPANTGAGISVGDDSLVEQCVASANSSTGIVAGAGCNLMLCTVRSNIAGIAVGADSTVTHCVSDYNFGHGITGDAVRIVGCTANNNTNSGIIIPTGSSASILQCTASFNGGDGIYPGASASVQDCTVFRNAKNGINCGNNSLIIGNTCNENGYPSSSTASGIFLAYAGCRVEANNVAGNHGFGIQDDSSTGSNVIIRNISRGNTVTNYAFVSSTVFGPLVNTGAGAMITTNNPWVNFSY